VVFKGVDQELSGTSQAPPSVLARTHAQHTFHPFTTIPDPDLHTVDRQPDSGELWNRGVA